MFDFGIYFWTILIVQGVIFGFATSYLAGQKNKDKTTWFFIGFFLGIIGLIIIAASKTEDNQASFSGSSYGGSTTNTIKASKSLSSNIRYIDLDSPVEVRNAEIKVDESTGMAYINAEFKNISDKNVSALKFTAICYNSFGEPVNDSDANKIELIMQDLDIGSKDTFGKNINYSLTGFEQTRVIDLMIDQVSFTNGEIWKKAESNLKDISSFKYDGDQELKKIAGEDAITYPLEDQDSWRCICAKFNRKTDNICINCGRVKSEVFNEYDRDGIKEKIIKFNEREQLEEAKSRKVKKNRSRVAIVISAFILVILVSLISLKRLKPFTFDKEIGGIEDYSSFGSKKVVIPNSIDGIEVKIIGGYAFANKGITEVIIPDSVTSIRFSAFKNNKLTTLTIPDSVTSIESFVFRNNKLTTLTIPDSVTSIGGYSFSENELTTITIPDSVTSIGSCAFADNKLTTLSIPDSVTSIEERAFSNNELTTISIPDSVKSLEKLVFDNNPLVSVSLPRGSKFKKTDFSLDHREIKFKER